MKIFSELRRREVFKTLALYIVGAWVVVQVADLLFAGWCIPESAIRHVWIAALLGVPIALVVSWQFDVSKAGLRRTITSGNDTRTLARSDYALLTALSALTVAIIVVQGQSVMATRDCGLEGPFNPPENSIAVLPFVSLGADEEGDWLGQGFALSVLDNLVNLPGAIVTSSDSSFDPRLKGKSIREVAKILDVAFVLAGSVQRQGNRLRITPQIIDARDDSNYWSSKIDRAYSDLFEIQDEVAEAATAAVEVVLSPDLRQRIDREGTDNLAALEAYSSAIDNLRTRTTDSVAQAVEQLKRAVELDRDFARAHAMLGHVYGDWRYGVWSDLTHAERRDLARDAANTALQIAPGLSMALTLLGDLTEDDDARAQLYREAVANGPNDTVALYAYADYLFDKGQTDEAMELAEKLIRLDPLDETNYTLLAGQQMDQFGVEAALETIARGKQKVSDSVPLRDLEHICYSVLGDRSSAIRVKHETLTTDPKEYYNRWLIAQDYFNVGMPAEAARWWERAAETAPERDQEIFRLMLRTTLDIYHQRNDEAVFESLQRWVTEAGERFGFPGPGPVYDIFIEYGDRLGRLDDVLSTFEDLAPQLFADPPTLERNTFLEGFVGAALLRVGDRQRGVPIVRSLLEFQEKDPDRGSVLGYVYVLLYLGDTEAALENFRHFAASKFVYVGLRHRFVMQNSPVWAPIRATPEYAALMEELDRNAAEHRRKLEEMDLPVM